MKYSASRKINLANIDSSYAYEMEELGIHDADSMEEATQKLDLAVKERILHYKEKALNERAAQEPILSKLTPPPAKMPDPVIPSTIPMTSTPIGVPVGTTPASPPTFATTQPDNTNPPGVSTSPPKGFE